MSATTKRPRRPVPCKMSSRAARNSFSWRLEITMSAPASAKPRAMALPSPLLPPVTRATLPVKRNISKAMCLLLPLLDVSLQPMRISIENLERLAIGRPRRRKAPLPKLGAEGYTNRKYTLWGKKGHLRYADLRILDRQPQVHWLSCLHSGLQE